MTTNIERLIEIMALLRDPDKGCPWDAVQDFASIAPHTIEEAYEVVEAIEAGDMAALVDELGDLLLQVVFHARMAEEADLFDFDSVAAAICDKLIRRHPHVFGDAVVRTASAQTRAWEDQKANERHDKATGNGEIDSVLDGVSVALPALTRAAKMQKRAARVGFDWRAAAEVLDKFREEIGELERELDDDENADGIEDEIGDLLFTCVNLARKLGIDPETALRRGNAKFERRFRGMERMLADRDGKLENTTLEEKEALWQRAKLEE
jgi:nucleoside triphosphate diphosphatase